MNKHQGLTLIEVLIALAIMAIALTAVIKATTQTINSTSYLQDKMIATWVAEMILNDARVGVIQIDKSQEKTLQKTTMLNRDWYWRLSQTTTPNLRIKKIAVAVFSRGDDAEDEDAQAIVNLETYVYQTDDNANFATQTTQG